MIIWMVFLALFAAMFVGAALLSVLRLFLRPVGLVACRIGWHTVGERTEHDDCSAHAKCRWCGYEGMIDSQGNLF